VHQPVLYQEIILALSPQSSGRYVDGTIGLGGHAWGILAASRPDGLLLGLDVDPDAIVLAEKRLAEFGERAKLIRGSYSDLSAQLEHIGWKSVDGILLDLGISSLQLDTPQRGFSFRSDAPLDMRFDPDNPVRAVDLINSLPESEIADILYRYGEERRSRQVARAIVAARPVLTTKQLADVVSSVLVSGRTKLHPATRTFQAFRIAVNRELEALESFLPQAVSALSAQAKLAVISFHSLEDRIVKHYFRRESTGCLCPPKYPLCTCGHEAQLRLLTKRPTRPGSSEILNNPRARSARLRVAQKI
jgi:16S rRNA (cytosine1402-N4)-methyltransferase